MFYAIWRPFTFLMGYTDPRKPTEDPLRGIFHNWSVQPTDVTLPFRLVAPVACAYLLSVHIEVSPFFIALL